MKTQKNILIIGDSVIDHHLLKGNKTEASGPESIGTSFTQTFGGAKLTFNLIEKFINKINEETPLKKGETQPVCYWPFLESPSINSSQGTLRDSYLRWEITEKEKDGKKEYHCRLSEKLGFGGHPETREDEWFKIDKKLKDTEYNTIVIDEAGIGFRNRKAAWPDFNNADSIFLKTTYPLCEGALWDELIRHKQKLITIVNLTQIKHYNIKVSSGISWEQTALDVVYGLHKDSTLKNLLKSKEVIITIGSAGAIIIKTSDDPSQNEYSLVFDPQFMENEWEEIYSKEIMNQIGLGSSFLAGLAASLSLKELSTVDSVKVGLNTMTAAMLTGVFRLTDKFLFEPADLSIALKERFKKRYFSYAYIPSPAWAEGLDYLQNPEWSILENNYDNKNGKIYRPKPDLFPLAFSLAEIGIDNLHYAPRLSLGSVTLFDRNEIENMRNIRKQVDFYDHYDIGKKPLNITVFGPPGAGKSFIVKAMANSMFESKRTKPSFLTFNLSQFKDESELPGAFHSIRDEVLKGKLPIVFWDEFDSNEYEWLKSLIAPMQDGEFQEGKEVHPIGKAIFVFAGGMTYTMQHFADKMEKPEYVGKKGPDFLSRINCSLNVFGPNRKPFLNGKTKKWSKEGDKKDNCFSIRRALFIRQLLSSGDKPLNIDRQLLRALIEVKCYKNGSRGLERLLKNLAVQSTRKIERSDLPSTEIIQMNVDYADFMDKLSDESSAENLVFEQIAVSVHNAWLEKNVAHSVYFKQYNDLSYDMRIDNICAAKRIKEVIEKTGKFILISMPELKSRMLADAKKEFDKYLEVNTKLDKLAEWEHKGWMKSRELARWKSGKRSDYHKTHNCIVPFNKLDSGVKDRTKQKEKNKDRDTLKKYTSMLEGSGYTITFK